MKKSHHVTAPLNLIFTLLLIAALQGCFSGSVKTSPVESQQRQSEGIVTATDISRDGHYSVVADNRGVCLWDIGSNSTLYPCITGDAASHIELAGISADNRYFFTSNRVSISLYSLTSGKLAGQWATGTNIIRDIAISEQGTVIAAGYRSGEVSIINTVSGTMKTHKAHRLDVNTVALTADGSVIISGASDKSAKLWQAQSGDLIHEFTMSSRVNYVDIDPAGHTGFAVDALNNRLFLDLKTGQEGDSLNISQRFVEFNDSAFSEDGKWFVTGSPNREIRLWNVSNGDLYAQ